MDKVPHIQDFSYLESDLRKKLDGFTVFSNGETEDMNEANIGKRVLKSLESGLKYDFRKSLAWDSAFSTCSGILEIEELFDTSNSWHSENGCDMLESEQDQHLSFNNLKPEIKILTDEFNLRRSLAWDSAFFTSEGILNPEELSLLNKGLKKSEIDMLPQIEELWISSDSNGAIYSNGSSLASLEVSMHQLREESRTVVSSSKIQKLYSTKRMNGDCVSKLKVNSRPTSTMQTINDNRPERTTKEQFVRPSWKFSATSGISDLSSHLKPPKISRGVRRSVPIAPTKRVPLLSNEVNGETKTVKASGKCLTKKLNMLKTCSNDNNSSTSTALSWEFSSLSSQSCKSDTNGLFSPYNILSSQSSPEFSIVKNDTLVTPFKHKIPNEITPEHCCHQTCSSVKKNCCCISPLVSIDGFSPASPVGASNTFHGDKGIMCSNPCDEVKGSNSVLFDASRTVKPSGLRMPSPKIGFFDVDKLLMSIENGGKKSHLKAVSKIQSGQKLKYVGNTRTCSCKTRNSTISKTMKFSPGAVSKADEGKEYCLRNDEKTVNVRANEPEFEGQLVQK